MGIGSEIPKGLLGIGGCLYLGVTYRLAGGGFRARRPLDPLTCWTPGHRQCRWLHSKKEGRTPGGRVGAVHWVRFCDDLGPDAHFNVCVAPPLPLVGAASLSPGGGSLLGEKRWDLVQWSVSFFGNAPGFFTKHLRTV